MSTEQPTNRMPQYIPSEELVQAVMAASVLWGTGTHGPNPSPEASAWAAADRQVRTRPGPHSRRWRAALGVILLSALAIHLLPALLESSRPIPVAVTGHWVTNDAQFHGRSMALTSDSIAITPAPGLPPERYATRVLRTRRQGPETWLDLEYATPEGLLMLEVSVAGDTLRLRNRPAVAWRRIPPLPAPAGP